MDHDNDDLTEGSTKNAHTLISSFDSNHIAIIITLVVCPPNLMLFLTSKQSIPPLHTRISSYALHCELTLQIGRGPVNSIAVGVDAEDDEYYTGGRN